MGLEGHQELLLEAQEGHVDPVVVRQGGEVHHPVEASSHRWLEGEKEKPVQKQQLQHHNRKRGKTIGVLSL